MKLIDIIIWTVFLVLLIYLVYNNICFNHIEFDHNNNTSDINNCKCNNSTKNKKKNIIIEQYNNIPKLKDKDKTKTKPKDSTEDSTEDDYIDEEQFYKRIIQNPIEKEADIKFIGYNKDYSNLYGNVKSVGEISLEATTDYPNGNAEFMD